MLSLIVSQNSDQRLTDQIVAGIKRQIDERHLRPGTRLPSIRNFAETYNVSRFTAAEAYEGYAAVSLFVERARSVHPSLPMTDANLRSMGEIARRLDGLPLAIELVGARAALFSPQELLARLDARFTLLTSGARDVPARHMTLARAIDWSYSLLSPVGQQVFRQLRGCYELEEIRGGGVAFGTAVNRRKQ